MMEDGKINYMLDEYANIAPLKWHEDIMEDEVQIGDNPNYAVSAICHKGNAFLLEEGKRDIQEIKRRLEQFQSFQGLPEDMKKAVTARIKLITDFVEESPDTAVFFDLHGMRVLIGGKYPQMIPQCSLAEMGLVPPEEDQ